MTEVIVKQLQRNGSVQCYNWSMHKPWNVWRWKLARAWSVCKTLRGLLLRGRRRGEVLYYPANSSWGLIYDMAILALGQALGYRIVLHHHSYAYIDRYDWRMAVVVKIVGARGAHAVHCQKMVDDYRVQYETSATFLTVPPTIVPPEPGSSQPPLTSDREPGRPFVLGFLSNLTLAKGLNFVLDTFENLANRGIKVRLILAGPCHQKVARVLVEQATNRWPDLIEYRGPVYGEQKRQFFSDIDAFLFPTQDESWGIVLTEALAYGRPVIAYDRGCVSYIIRNGCGKVVPWGEEFAPAAAAMIEHWTNDAQLYRQASHLARQRRDELELEAEKQLPLFVSQLLSGLPENN